MNCNNAGSGHLIDYRHTARLFSSLAVNVPVSPGESHFEPALALQTAD
jgi:hypothetical protein